MALKIEPDFKEALLNLPEKEKNKYFLRLLKKDKILFHRLHFELVSLDTVDDRRNKLEEKIILKFKNSNAHSANYIKTLLRYTSGDITYHVRTTSDKFGEPYLNTIMLIKALEKFNPKISNNMSYAAEKLNKYIVARVFKILLLVQKLHEDEHYDFKELFEVLTDLIQENNSLEEKMDEASFNYDWLLELEIPEDLNSHVKHVRSQKII